MSQHSLASKTISKRNVAQSSVIFSVVVAVITLGLIATVAYVDIKEEINSVATAKSIPEMIAEQKIRSEENRKKAELISQAEDLVITLDQRANDLKRLQQKVNKANEQLNVINTHVQMNTPTEKLKSVSVDPVRLFNTLKTVQTMPAQITQKNNEGFQMNLDSVFEKNHALKIKSAQSVVSAGEVFFEVSWLFKARGNMGVKQEFLFNHQLKTQSKWNAKTI